ncbi:MAG: transposase [Sulfurimonas sp.]|nr:MAG: transposase [Sulfurimonas sp.]
MSDNYKQGLNRKQQLLFPPSLDEYVDNDNPVRVIDGYVDILDLSSLGFKNLSKASNDGQPAYHPNLIIKIYIYSYLNKIRSSRAIEKECKRNIELMWLTQGLTPSYKTISNFRKNNYKALKQLFKEFVLLCKNINLIDGNLVAVDGAYLRANASKNRLIMKKSLQKDLIEIDSQICEYLKVLEFSDKEKQPLNLISKLPKDLRKLKYKKEELANDLKLLDNLGKTQHNRTDKDAALMRKPAHHLMAYNSQIVVDDTFKFIVATDISTSSTDQDQLHKMAMQTKDILEKSYLTIVADKGYNSSIEIKKCVDDNINPIVPLSNKQQTQKDKGKFSREAFVYDKDSDSYICPNNKKLTKREAPQIRDNGKVNYVYSGASAICKSCPIKDKCLPTKTPYKSIFRWEHENIIEQHSVKMQTDEAKAIIKKRGSIVEHPFGTIKRNLGWDHFLVRGKNKVSGENALIMFTYNFKRLLNLIGVTLFQKLLIALKDGNIRDIREEIALYIANSLQNSVYFFKIYFIFGVRGEKLK